MRLYIYIYLVIIISFLDACSSNFKGDLKPNLSPKTYLTCDTINRIGNNRMTSQVLLKWWGDDADGFIKYYIYSFDGVNWIKTNKQDSVFSLQIPSGKDTFDFKFQVKAVDNLGLEDPIGASLGVPVKNSAPSVNFIIPQGTIGAFTRNPTQSFPVLKYYWQANDPDGNLDIDHFEICLNDTNNSTVNISSNFTEITLVAKDPQQISSNVYIYQGVKQILLSNLLGGMLMDNKNILYIRAVDKVGSKSVFSASSPIFVKKIHGNILLVNGMISSSGKTNALQFYTNALKTLNINNFDTISVTDVMNNNYTELSPDNITQSTVFGLFKHIIWFTDDANNSLSFAKKTLNSFSSNNGTILMTVAFNSQYDSLSNNLDFTPVKQLVSMPQGVTHRLNTNSNLNSSLNGWPILSNNSSPFVCRPILKQENLGNYTYEYIYNTTIAVSGSINKNWQDNDSTNIVIKRIKNATNKTDFIFSSVPFEKLMGNNMNAFLQKALINELEF